MNILKDIEQTISYLDELEDVWDNFNKDRMEVFNGMNVSGSPFINPVHIMRTNLRNIKERYVELLEEAYEAQKEIAKYRNDY